MSKIYFFVESRIGKVPTLIIFSAIVLLLASGILSIAQFTELYSLIIGWFN